MTCKLCRQALDGEEVTVGAEAAIPREGAGCFRREAAEVQLKGSAASAGYRRLHKAGTTQAAKPPRRGWSPPTTPSAAERSSPSAEGEVSVPQKQHKTKSGTGGRRTLPAPTLAGGSGVVEKGVQGDRTSRGDEDKKVEKDKKDKKDKKKESDKKVEKVEKDKKDKKVKHNKDKRDKEEKVEKHKKDKKENDKKVEKENKKDKKEDKKDKKDKKEDNKDKKEDDEAEEADADQRLDCLLRDVHVKTVEKPCFYDQLQQLDQEQQSEVHLAGVHVKESVERLDTTNEQVSKLEEIKVAANAYTKELEDQMAEANAYSKNLEDQMKKLEVQKQTHLHELEANYNALEAKKKTWERTRRTVKLLALKLPDSVVCSESGATVVGVSMDSDQRASMDADQGRSGFSDAEERRSESSYSPSYYSEEEAEDLAGNNSQPAWGTCEKQRCAEVKEGDDMPRLRVGFRRGMACSFIRLPLGASICSIQNVFDAAKPVLFPGDDASHFTPRRGYVSFKSLTHPGHSTNVRLADLTEHEFAGSILGLDNLIDVTFTDY